MPVTIEQIQNLKPGQSVVYFTSSGERSCYALSCDTKIKDHVNEGYIEDRYILTQRLVDRTKSTHRNNGFIGTFEYIVTRKVDPPCRLTISKNKDYRERLKKGEK